MDLFRRNNASRQSSFDAHFPADDAPDFWMPPGTAASYAAHADLPSPPDHARDSSVRRSSVFTLRSRSNTATSTSSKVVCADELDRGARRSSRDASAHRTSASLSEPPAAKPKSMFAARGRKLRRPSRKLSNTSPLDEAEDATGSRRGSVFGKDRKKNSYESAEQYNLRMRHISGPLDFHHLTHTKPQQFTQALEQSQNELVAEFWAHRASQMPKPELRGIKAEDLQSTNYSSEALTNVTRPNSEASSSSRSPLSRDLPSPSPKSDPPPVRHTRSIGSFSQPLPPTSPNSPPVQLPPMPPRGVSRLAMARGDENPIAQAYSCSHRGSGFWGDVAFHRPSVSNEFVNDLPFIPHAVTTPDDTAIPAISPSWGGTDLEHIAEEEEGYFARRSYEKSTLFSPSPDMSPTQKPEPPPTSDLPLRSDHMGTHEHLRSFANSRATRPRPLSQMSDTLGAPFIPAKKSSPSPVLRSASSRRRSTFFKPLDNNSWEDDIDYCYDIAAEADFDFDWDRRSADRYTPVEARFPPTRTSTVMEEVEEEEDDGFTDQAGDAEEKLHGSFMPQPLRPSLVVHNSTSLPDLDYRSGVSTSTHSLSTPVDARSTRSSKRNTVIYQAGEVEGLYTPSLLVPQDFKYPVAKDDMYEDLLDDYESDRPFALLHTRSDNALSIAESSHSGPSRLSMGSSYDSSLRSASCSLASPARRSRSSAGSVPELVHSRRARRTADIMVDRLSKEMAAIARLGEEDDDDDEDCDGSASTEHQTFFADQADDSDDDETESRPTMARGPKLLAKRPDLERAKSEGVQAHPHSRTGSSSSEHSLPSHRSRSSKAFTLSLFPAPPRTPKTTS